ncbi:hypothetical protein BDZ97DRAFT_1792634 [Flammula alnicola]|nr:hypothetical protein BDZ97DRAFT_1792634 [Flammula alnicola]
MKFSIFALTTIRALFVFADTAKLVPITYVGPITPGGANLTITGTPKEIYDQIIEMNPKYNIVAFNLEKRDFISIEERTPDRVACNVEGGAIYSDIAEGIDYLNNLGAGACNLGPKPACSRVTCSDNSAIYYCNDNSYTIGPSCNYLGYGMAQAILNQCAVCSGSCTLSGQAWDTQNYNIIVGASNNFGEGHC